MEPEPHVVTVEYWGSFPIFIMYREGSGPWQVPEETSMGYTSIRRAGCVVLGS